MKRPGKPEGPHYLSHQTLDTDHGIILDVTETSGDSGDPAPYLDQIERVHRDVIPIQAATADAAYDVPLAHEVLSEHGITFYACRQSHFDRTQAELKRDAFSYDSNRDCFLCPNGKGLYLTTLQRSASSLHWVYLADKRECRVCPLREKCILESNTSGARTLKRNYFQPAIDRNIAHWDTAEYREALKKRRIWSSEGTFAAQKPGDSSARAEETSVLTA